MRTTKKCVVMLGVGEDSRGGMTAVVRTYRRSGLFAAWNVRYLTSYIRPGVGTQLRTAGRAFFALFCALLRGNVALVHVHSASRGSFWRKSSFAALAYVFRVSYVFHVHSGEFVAFYEKRGTLAKAWMRLVLRNAAHVLVLTEGWRRELQRIEPAADYVVLPNPVELPQQTAAPASADPVILFLGRLREKKGIYDLIAAMPHVLAQFPRATFVCAGDGEEDEVRAAARELGVDHALRLPGWIDEDAKSHWLGRATMLVLPSHFEALPVSLLEAMAHGVPVVATRVGGIPDLVDDERCGLLVAPRDPAALANAIRRLLADAALSARLAHAARREVEERYAVEAINARLGRLYEDLGARPAARAWAAEQAP